MVLAGAHVSIIRGAPLSSLTLEVDTADTRSSKRETAPRRNSGDARRCEDEHDDDERENPARKPYIQSAQRGRESRGAAAANLIAGTDGGQWEERDIARKDNCKQEEWFVIISCKCHRGTNCWAGARLLLYPQTDGLTHSQFLVCSLANCGLSQPCRKVDVGKIFLSDAFNG